MEAKVRAAEQRIDEREAALSAEADERASALQSALAVSQDRVAKRRGQSSHSLHSVMLVSQQ